MPAAPQLCLPALLGLGVWRKWKQGKFLAALDRALMAQTAQECDLTDTGTAALQTLSLRWVWIC